MSDSEQHKEWPDGARVAENVVEALRAPTNRDADALTIAVNQLLAALDPASEPKEDA